MADKKKQSGKLTAEFIVASLKSRGMTKWAIKKSLGVSWETVNTWSKGHGEPSPENYAALRNLYREKLASADMK